MSEMLDRAAVARRLGVRPKTVTEYGQRGDFPEPDGYVGRSPWWWPATIDGWQATRPGRGAGGGRPSATDWWRDGGGDLLLLTGWIGEHPRDGRDVAHLLLYPAGHGVAGKMRVLAEALGLSRMDAMTRMEPVPAELVSLHLVDAVAVVVHGDRDLIRRPVSDEWQGVALARRFVVLTVGVDGAQLDGVGDVERYLGRPHRLYTGLVAART